MTVRDLRISPSRPLSFLVFYPSLFDQRGYIFGFGVVQNWRFSATLSLELPFNFLSVYNPACFLWIDSSIGFVVWCFCFQVRGSR